MAAAVTTPFLATNVFESMFRPLSVGERTLADKLLLAATQWIVDRRDEAGNPIVLVPPDPMGFLVCFEVVRACFPVVPDLQGRTQYTIVTDDRTETGTLASAAGLLDFDERMRVLLGLSATSGPVYGGMDANFGDPELDASPMRRTDYYGNPIEQVVVGRLP